MVLPDSNPEIEGGAVMMDEKRLEQEYRRLKRQQAPDLWNRIEGSLREHPERGRSEGSLQEHLERNRNEENFQKNSGKGQDRERIPFSRHRIYGLATAAAAVLALLIAVPGMMEGRFEKSSENMALLMAGDAAETTAENDMAAKETGADMALSSEIRPEAAPGDAMAEGAEAEAGKPEAGPEAAAEAGKPATAGPGAAAGAGKPATAGPGTAAEVRKPEAAVTGAAPEGEAKNRENPAAAPEAAPEGVLSYGELKLAAYRPVELPENAVTFAEDSMYFSEDILRDAGLLCGGTVNKVSLEQDESGKAVKVVYEITLDQVYFAEDYMTGTETITVKSPIVRTDGDEVYILYQLQPGGTYLLPLHKPGQDWELLYPFAPQIQVTGDGAYLFHTGYASLVNEDTFVVIGSPEGRNDYFYDRMVLRNDENFLSELLALIEH